MARSEAPVLYRPIGLSAAAEIRGFGTPLSGDASPYHDQAALIDQNLWAVDKITQYIRGRRVAVVEPYPLQLWGGVEDERQSAGFQAGFRFISKLRDADTIGKIKYFALEDDVTNAPARISQEVLSQRREKLYASSSSIQDSPFANPVTVGPNRHRVFTQSAIARGAGSSACSRIDAEFNYNKVVEQFARSGKGGILNDVFSLNQLLLVVIHPDTPWMKEQQLVMLQALFEKMRSRPIFQVLTRAQTRISIEQMFRHVWINSEGEVTAVSRPSNRINSNWVHDRELLG